MSSIASIATVGDSAPLWAATASRNGYSVKFTVSLDDGDGQATASERDNAVLALADSLATAGFTVASVQRLDLTYIGLS